MTNKNPIHQDESSLPLEAEDSPDIELHARLHAVWPADQLPNLETGIADKVSDDAELDSGFDDDTLATTTNPVVLYLQEVKSIPLLSRDKDAVREAFRLDVARGRVV